MNNNNQQTNNNQKTEEVYKYIKSCVLITEKIEQLNEEIKKLKEKKEQLEKIIIPNLVRMNLNKKAIQYKDRKIYVKNENVYPNLSYKYLNEKLNKFFKGGKKELVAEICQFLKDERDIKKQIVLNI